MSIYMFIIDTHIYIMYSVCRHVTYFIVIIIIIKIFFNFRYHIGTIICTIIHITGG